MLFSLCFLLFKPSCSQSNIPRPDTGRRNQDSAGRNRCAQTRNGASRNPIFTTKDTKNTKKNRTICHIQYFVSFVLFVVNKFCRK